MIADALASMFFGRSAALSFDRLDPRDPAIAKILGLGMNAKSGVRVDGETILGIPAMFRGIEIISNALMKVKPIIYRRLPGADDDRERDKNHPSWRVVTRQANPLMSAGMFRKVLTSWALARGNGLGVIIRDGAGRCREMLPLLPDRSGLAIFRAGQRMGGEADVQEGDVVRYWTLVGGEVRKLPPEDVIHIMSLSGNGVWGYDLVTIMRETLGACIAARDFSASFFGQGAMGSGIVFMPPGLEGKAQQDFVEAVRKGSEGLTKAHRLMLLEDGAKYEKLTIEPEKAALVGVMAAQRIDIANIVGIQPHKVGDSSRVAYNSLEQSNQEHLDDDLDPRLQTWEDQYNEKVLTEEEKANDTHFVEFNRSALVRVNLQARTARDQFERQNGIATANDIIRRQNGRPLGAVGDTYLVPANMTVLNADGLPVIRGQAAPEPQAPQRSPQDPPSDDPADDPADDDNPDDANARAQLAEVALFECERLATRAVREAVEAARQGPGKFAEWLDRLPTWSKRPRPLEGVLGVVLAHVHEALDAYTEAPYTAADLAANVAAAADAIQAGAIQAAREQWEVTL